MDNNTKKTFAHAMLWLAAVPIIGFMSWRNIMLVNLTLPGDSWYFGLAAVGAMEGGLFVWAMLYRWYAHNNAAQRVICIFMMAISALGSVSGFLTETFIQAGAKGNVSKLDPAIITFAIWIMSGVIAANAIAGLLFFVLEIGEVRSEQPTSLPRPSYSAQFMPPQAAPQALENPKVAEVTTTKRQLPEPQISRFKNVTPRPKLSTRVTKK